MYLIINTEKLQTANSADDKLIFFFFLVAGYYGFTLDVCMSVRPSVRFLFPDDDLSKHQWIFTKLGVCIDIVDIWFGIANG